MLTQEPERPADAPASAPAGPPVERRTRRRRLRAPLVELHRWASLALTLWVCLMAVTGSLLVFGDRIIGWQHPGLFAHGVGDTGATRAVAAARRAEPSMAVTGFTTPAVSDGVYTVSFTASGQDAPAGGEAGARRLTV